MSSLFQTVISYFDHDAIRIHCGRPFKTTDDMNNVMLTNWNGIVSKDDTVFVLGDLAWKRHGFWINELNGKKIMIFGNHDKMREDHQRCFTRSYGDPKNPGIHQTTIEGQQYVIMSHYPLYSWNGSMYGSWHFHGHCHGRKRERLELGAAVPETYVDPVDAEELPPERVPEYNDGLACAVDVDVWDFTPVPWEVLKTKMTARIPAWRERMERIHNMKRPTPEYPEILAAANRKWRTGNEG